MQPNHATMQPTRYLIADDAAAAELALKKEALRENRGLTDFKGFAAGVMERNLRNHPERYLEFGPYWWAVKEALARNGCYLGEETAPALAAVYTGTTDEAIFIKAEMFKGLYRSTWAAGTNTFELDEHGGPAYLLLDLDMQSLIDQKASA